MTRGMTDFTDAPALVLPSAGWRDSYLEALAEGYSPGTGVPGVADLDEHLAWLNRQGDTVTLTGGGSVVRGPHVQYWLVRGETFLGRVNIRFELTENLLIWGGNIGYEIRPAWRGRGYGRLILAMALPHARAAGLGSVLLTCLASNTASIRVIEANGGVLEARGVHPEHADWPTLRWRIAL